MMEPILPNLTSVPAEYFPIVPVLAIEKEFDYKQSLTWFQQYWTIGFVFCFIYVVLIYTGQLWMKNRERFQLQVPLTLWSLSLAIFSWVCAIRMWSEFYYIVHTYGWHETVCDPIFIKSVSGFWTSLFVWSKLIEFGDTSFIVLRKQNLIFLHYYHHVTVLLYSWVSWAYAAAPGRYFILVNATVHALMYSYYAAKASKLFTIPKYVNIFLTLFQISQMVVGMCVNFYALHALNAGHSCSTSYDNIQWSFLMYLSYFALFMQFFYKTYFAKQKRVDQKHTSIGMDKNDNEVTKKYL